MFCRLRRLAGGKPVLGRGQANTAHPGKPSETTSETLAQQRLLVG
jgi:hypothetical protein